jgi:transglutaminase-like putative cysteine protease
MNVIQTPNAASSPMGLSGIRERGRRVGCVAALAVFLGSAVSVPGSATAASPKEPAQAPVPGSGSRSVSAGAGTTRRPPSAPRAAPQKPLDILTVPRPAGPEWYGLYLVGKKAGYSQAYVGLEMRDGHEVLVARTATTLSATVGDRQVERSQSDEKVYEPRPGGRLLAFSSRRRGDGGDRELVGRCTPAGCVAELTAEGRRDERKLPQFHETAEQADGARLAAATGKTVRGEQLDLEGLRVKQVEDRFVKHLRVAGAGVESSLALVEETEVGDRAATRLSIASDGRIVEMRMGDAIVARAEPEDVARRLDRVDIFGMTRVKLAGPLPREIPGRIVFQLRGIPKEFQAGDARQSWSVTADGTAVLTVTARAPRAAEPAHDAPRAREGSSDEYLAATPEIDADAPPIRELAKRVVGDTRGTYAAATRIVQHVYKRLEKAYGVSRDRASEVLTLGKGDCTEHALLFTALARAAGIPARQVHGLVYARYEDDVPALYWHAWVEVRSGEEWVALDPTFGQNVADATHIALGRGTQVDTVGLLGALQVAAAQPRPAG